MNKRKVKLDDLQEGMKVAADVKNLDDMLLIPAGCELTARHIRILQTWGVAEVSIESGEEDTNVNDPLKRLPPEVLERLQGEVASSFQALDLAQPVQAELFRLLVLRRARRAFGGQPS